MKQGVAAEENTKVCRYYLEKEARLKRRPAVYSKDTTIWKRQSDAGEKRISGCQGLEEREDGSAGHSGF